MVLYSLLFERRCQCIETLFERSSDFQRVGAELGGCLDEDARFTGDQRIAEARLGTVAYGCDVAQAYRQPSVRSGHRLRQRIGRGAGGLRLNDDALHRRFDVAAANQGSGALRRG